MQIKPARGFDVAVIGAGPAGSSTAITLARLGYAVILLDRARFPRHKLCGDFLNPINWPALEDLGVADAVRECQHVKIGRFAASSANGRITTGPLPLQALLCSGLGIQRYFLDDVLINGAKHAGVAVEEGCNVTAISRERAGWAIKCRASGGGETRYARLLVGADGRNSKVARQLKLATVQAKKPGSVGFQMRLKLASGVRDSVEVHEFAGGYAGIVRLDHETINLAFTIERSCLRAAASFENLRKHYLDGNSALRDLLSRAAPCDKLRSIWPVYFPARKRYGDDFLLVGDAAQVTEPVTGEGVYFALKSGQLAAQAIAEGLQNPQSLRLKLARYDSACTRQFSRRTRLNATLRILIRHPSLFGAAVFLLERRKGFLRALLRQVCGGASRGNAAA
jgi:geranylgeranyl reductase family protein